MWKTVHLISSALSPLTFIEVFGSAKNVPQPKRTPSYNRGPFLCPGEAAVRQLQAAHRALPVSDEEHASGFPLHQRRCHYTLRAHAEVKSHRHRIASRTSPLPAVEPGTRSAHSPRETHEHFSGLVFGQDGGPDTNISVIFHYSFQVLTICSKPQFFFKSEIGSHLTYFDLEQHVLPHVLLRNTISPD